MDPILLATLASGVLGGGVFGAGVSLWTAKRKVPAEVDSIIVTGAETAVVALQGTLSAETRRADRAEKTVTQQYERIENLERRLDQLQQLLDDARNELRSIINSK